MTKREIGFVACRLMAVYLFMQGLWQLSNALSGLNFLDYTVNSGKLVITFNGANPTAAPVISLLLLRLLPTVLTYAGVFGLWIFAGEIAKRLFDGAPAEIERGEPLVVGFEARGAAFACLGMFFLVNDFVSVCWLLARPIVNLFSASVPDYNNYGLPSWQVVVRILVSLWLVFGARGLAGLWRLARRDHRNIEAVDRDRN